MPTCYARFAARDLECLTTVDKVQEAVERRVGNSGGEMKISLIATNGKGLRMAFVQRNERHAVDLLKTKRIKIG